MDYIAVLIPCYNEGSTIKKVIEDYKKYLPESTVYVYDNNSIDDTAVIAKEAGAIIRYEFKQGKGNVIRRMFREVDALCYIMTDGDDTYPAEYAKQMVDSILLKQNDMVIGDRLSSTYFTENKRPFHNMGNNLVRNTINRLFKCSIKDIMTGYRAFSYTFVKTFPVLSKGFEIETEMSIHAVDKNMSIENVIVEYRDRPLGSVSKLNTYTDGIKVLKTIGKLYKNYKPFGFFATLGGGLTIISFSLFLPIFFVYIKTGLVPQIPTLIVSCFIELAAIQAFFAGLVLSTIVDKTKQEFEYKLQLTQSNLNMLWKNLSKLDKK